jgi:hypothetical protein
VVGGLSVAYAIVAGGCLGFLIYAAQTNQQPNPRPNPRDVPWNDFLSWLALCSFSLTPVIELLASCLLFLRQAASLRAAQLLLFAAAIGLLSEALLMIAVTMQAAGSGPTGGTAIFVTGPVFIMASLWAAVTLITAIKLGLHLKKPVQDDSRRRPDESA